MSADRSDCEERLTIASERALVAGGPAASGARAAVPSEAERGSGRAVPLTAEALTDGDDCPVSGPGEEPLPRGGAARSIIRLPLPLPAMRGAPL